MLIKLISTFHSRWQSKMSHFDMENDINSILRMDAPLTKGPQMRWQRKLNESCNTSVKNDSVLNCSQPLNASSAKTPLKMSNGKGLKYSGNSKTPKKTPLKTPGRFKPSCVPSGSFLCFHEYIHALNFQ